jgi:hypothetical protein
VADSQRLPCCGNPECTNNSSVKKVRLDPLPSALAGGSVQHKPIGFSQSKGKPPSSFSFSESQKEEMVASDSAKAGLFLSLTTS